MRSLLGSSQRRKRAIVVIATLILLGAMVVDTKFVDATADSAGQQQQAFNAAEYAKEKWPEQVAALEEKAVDVVTLAPAVEADLAEAGRQYGQDLGAGSYSFPVKATGTVTEVDDNFITLSVANMPEGDVVRIPLGLALNGLPLRDAPGTILFGDFTNQTDYQAVANAFQAIARAEVLGKITPADLQGKQITVIGGFASGGPPKTYNISPAKIEVSS